MRRLLGQPVPTVYKTTTVSFAERYFCAEPPVEPRPADTYHYLAHIKLLTYRLNVPMPHVLAEVWVWIARMSRRDLCAPSGRRQKLDSSESTRLATT